MRDGGAGVRMATKENNSLTAKDTKERKWVESRITIHALSRNAKTTPGVVQINALGRIGSAVDRALPRTGVLPRKMRLQASTVALIRGFDIFFNALRWSDPGSAAQSRGLGGSAIAASVI